METTASEFTNHLNGSCSPSTLLEFHHLEIAHALPLAPLSIFSLSIGGLLLALMGLGMRGCKDVHADFCLLAN